MRIWLALHVAIDGECRDDLAGRRLTAGRDGDGLERTRHGRLQLHDRFVGFNFDKRLTAADRLTDLGQPLHDLDRVVHRAQIGHAHREFHHASSPITALPQQPSNSIRSSTASHTARRPATRTSSGPPIPSRR